MRMLMLWDDDQLAEARSRCPLFYDMCLPSLSPTLATTAAGSKRGRGGPVWGPPFRGYAMPSCTTTRRPSWPSCGSAPRIARTPSPSWHLWRRAPSEGRGERLATDIRGLRRLFAFLRDELLPDATGWCPSLSLTPHRMAALCLENGLTLGDVRRILREYRFATQRSSRDAEKQPPGADEGASSGDSGATGHGDPAPEDTIHPWDAPVD